MENNPFGLTEFCRNSTCSATFWPFLFRTIFSDHLKNDAALVIRVSRITLSIIFPEVDPIGNWGTPCANSPFMLCVNFAWDIVAYGVANLIGKSIVASALLSNVGQDELPSGKHTKNYGKSPFFMGKLTIYMAIFNSYFDITGGYVFGHCCVDFIDHAGDEDLCGCLENEKGGWGGKFAEDDCVFSWEDQPSCPKRS